MIAEAAIFKVRVTECFCGSQSLLWVEFQHLREEVYSFVGSIAGQTIELMQIARFQCREQATHGHVRDNMDYILSRRCSEEIRDHLQLRGGVCGFEEDTATDQLCKYASNGPHVNLDTVVNTASKEFRSTIVLSNNLHRHWFIAVRLYSSSKAEVTYFNPAVAVNKDVTGLQVAVDDVC
jgi:hypothetical protein